MPVASRSFQTINPATGEVLAEIPEASEADLNTAVDAARDAFGPDGPWRSMPPAQRAQILWRVGDLIDDHADELAELETRDQGQPIGIARQVSVAASAEHFRYYAGWVTKLAGDTNPLSFPNTFNYTLREPVGVCGLIVPWNFPLMITSWKLAPALACANTCVVKPAEQTPLTAMRLAELIAEAGVPEGVVNVVTGGPDTGAAIAEHPGIDKVSFTGSTEVGRSIVRAAAGNLKRVSLELGGKNPVIVFADAPLEDAVSGVLQGGLLNSGQVCAAYSRIYVERPAAEEFAEAAAAAASSMKLGPGVDPDTQLGPLVSFEHRESVEGYIRTGVDEGAKLLGGGERPDGDLADGAFLTPAIFDEVDDGMTIAKEEIFGPVICVLPFDDVDDVVNRANATDYGLGASIWTRDIARAHGLAQAVSAGNVWVNMPNPLDAAAPWGGVKASGWGREMGKEALDLYSEVKSVWMALG
jgi:acyl-CoA reductase-like NAD-dependent aldehyde dehydrogenase